QVAMDQTLSRCRHQCARDLDCDFESQFWIEGTIPTHASLQGFALDQLHCVETATAIGRSTELINGGHIGMPQSSGGAGFPQTPFAFNGSPHIEQIATADASGVAMARLASTSC